MPSFYPDSVQFPKTVKAIMESVIIYTAQILYPDLYIQDPIQALKRIIISDLDAGNEFLLRTQTNYFESLNFEFPITFYQIENREFKTNYNQVISRGEVYSFELKRMVSGFPNGLTIKMITLYNHPDDYMRAITILQNTNASLTRLYSATRFIDYEHNINKILPIPFDLIWEVERGSYTFKFQEYLKINKLYDIVHTAKINFWDFLLSSDYLENFETSNLIFNTDSLNKGNVSDEFIKDIITIPMNNSNRDTFRLLGKNIYSSILEGDIINSSTTSITFYFKYEVNQLSLENTFILFPYLDREFIWNDNGNELTVKFKQSLSPSTSYEIDFTVYINDIPEDYSLNFSTREFDTVNSITGNLITGA